MLICVIALRVLWGDLSDIINKVMLRRLGNKNYQIPVTQVCGAFLYLLVYLSFWLDVYLCLTLKMMATINLVHILPMSTSKNVFFSKESEPEGSKL